MTDLDLDKERAAFEAQCAKDGWLTWKWPAGHIAAGDYQVASVDAGWKFWQARAALAGPGAVVVEDALASVEWLANNAKGISLTDWGLHSARIISALRFRQSGEMCPDTTLSTAALVDGVMDLFPSADKQALQCLAELMNKAHTERRILLALATPPAAPAPETLGRFGHHPDPVIDFSVEVEAIQGEVENHKVGFANGTPLREDLAARIERAMSFRVGGDKLAVEAKEELRKIEKEFIAAPAPEGKEPVGFVDPRSLEDMREGRTTFVSMHATKGGLCTPLYTAPSPEPADDDLSTYAYRMAIGEGARTPTPGAERVIGEAEAVVELWLAVPEPVRRWLRRGDRLTVFERDSKTYVQFSDEREG